MHMHSGTRCHVMRYCARCCTMWCSSDGCLRLLQSWVPTQPAAGSPRHSRHLPNDYIRLPPCPCPLAAYVPFGPQKQLEMFFHSAEQIKLGREKASALPAGRGGEGEGGEGRGGEARGGEGEGEGEGSFWRTILEDRQEWHVAHSHLEPVFVALMLQQLADTSRCAPTAILHCRKS